MRCVGEERVTCGMLHTVNSDGARNDKNAKKKRKRNNTTNNKTTNNTHTRPNYLSHTSVMSGPTLDSIN